MIDEEFTKIVATVTDAHLVVNQLLRDPGRSVDILRAGLQSKSNSVATAIWILEWLPVRVTEPLVGDLVPWAVSPRYAADVRSVLGRLPKDLAESLVPDFVAGELRASDDDYGLRQVL